MTATTRNASLEDLVRILKDQQGRRLDVVAPASQMRSRGANLVLRGTEAVVDEDGVTATDGVYVPTAVFDEGVADKLGIPVGYLRKLREQAPDLYDVNVNAWLHGKSVRRGDELEVVRPADDRSFFLRLFRGDGDLGVARAMLSDKYRAIDNFDILTAALAGVQESGTEVSIKQTDLSDRRMYVDVFAPAVAAMAPVLLGGYRNPFANAQTAERRRGGVSDVEFWRGVAHREGQGYAPGSEPVVFAGFRISNSEVGQGAFSITPKLLIKICRNGLVLPWDAIRSVHLGGKLDEGVVEWSGETQQKQLELITSKTKDAVAAFLDEDYLRANLTKIEKGAGAEVTEPEKEIKAIAKSQGYTKDEAAGILGHFIQGGQMTAGGVVNAVTSYSQTVPDADRADELDRGALKILNLS